MAVTHADLAIDRSCRSIGSKWGTWVMIICTLLGLLAFVFGLLAEITKTETVWITGEVGSGGYVRCMYVDSGRSALVSGVGSMLAMGVAMGIGQAYMWMALCTASATDTFRPLAAWTESDSNHYTIFRWQALASLFSHGYLLQWAAVLLIIGIAVEAGHTERQNVVRYKCTVVREGVFAAAGVFGLFATCMGVAFYASAVQTERLQEEEDNVRREIMELTIHYTPTSPPSPSIQQHPTFSGDLQK